MASTSNNLNSGMKCVKYMLLTINFMFMVTSLLLILVGTTIQAIFGDFKQFIDSHFLSPTALLVAVGCIMLFVSTFGCFGAIKGSTMLINVYGLLLLLIFILEISAAIAAFVMQADVRSTLIRTMNYSIHNYQENDYYTQGVDFMQSQLQCCGIDNPIDWDGILLTRNETSAETIILPMSCCARFTDDEPIECLGYFRSGCLSRMIFLVKQSAMLIATGATTVAFVQILGVLCAFMLAKTIRRNKSLREARRWQLQQSLGILATGGKNLQNDGYTQMQKSEKCLEPPTYTATSPSVN